MIVGLIYFALCQVPWTDLRYLFGEIMYGGHITDDWDRRLCRTYLEEYMKPDMVRWNLACIFVNFGNENGTPSRFSNIRTIFLVEFYITRFKCDYMKRVVVLLLPLDGMLFGR